MTANRDHFTILDAPPVKIDGIPVAITSDLSVSNDLSDRGTGNSTRFADWTQGEIDSIAARGALLVAPERVTR